MSHYECDKCGSKLSAVVQTCLQHDGRRVRRRRCNNCQHTWYTLQAPEVKISGRGLYWANGTVIGLPASLGSPKNGKI